MVWMKCLSFDRKMRLWPESTLRKACIMMTDTLKKLKRLEQYLSAANAAVDPVLDRTLDKLLAREIANTREATVRLESQVGIFEKMYGMTSETFYEQYVRGDLGDKMDFIEWAATIEMLRNAEKRLEALKQGSAT